MKHKVLVINLKCPVGKDSVPEIMEFLADGDKLETELVICKSPSDRRFLLGHLHPYANFSMVIIVWEWLFDIEDIKMFARALHRELGHLLMFTYGSHPRCHEILRQTGCIDSAEAMLEALSKRNLENAST